MEGFAGRQVSAALGWSFLSQAVRIGSQTFAVVILARLLPPADFGLMAMASVVTGFAFLFRDLGTTAALIQRPELTPNLLNSVFLFNIAAALILAGIVAASAPVVALFFSELRLRGLLWTLSLAFPIGALAMVHQALLERAAHFKPVVVVESGAALLGLVAVVWAASAGWGAYSLAAQTFTVAVITTVGMWGVSPWHPVLGTSLSEIKGLWSFSSNLVGFNLFNYIARNADQLLVGRCLGAAELGYYTMAYKLMLWPLQNIASVTGRALFPVFARLQANPERTSAAYLRVTASICLITAPMMVGLFVLRKDFVAVVLGPEWLPIQNLLFYLAPIGLVQSIGTTVGILYLALGRTDLMFRWGIVSGIIVIIAFTVGIHWGLDGLLRAYAVATAILLYPLFKIPLRLIGLRCTKMLRRLLPTLSVAAMMGLVIAVVGSGWDFFVMRCGDAELHGTLTSMIPETWAFAQMLLAKICVWAKVVAIKLGLMTLLGGLVYLWLSWRYNRHLLLDIKTIALGQ